MLEEGEERKFLSRTGQEFSRFLTMLLNLKNGSKMLISTENKFSKLPGEVFKTAADSFYATQFNFTMRRGTIVSTVNISLNASFSHSSNSSQTLTKMSSSRNGKRTSDCSFLQKPFLLEMLFMVLVMIVFQVSDVFVSKTSTHSVVRLDQGGGVSIKLWGSKSSISPAIGSSIEAKCLKVA